MVNTLQNWPMDADEVLRVDGYNPKLHALTGEAQGYAAALNVAWRSGGTGAWKGDVMLILGWDGYIWCYVTIDNGEYNYS